MKRLGLLVLLIAAPALAQFPEEGDNGDRRIRPSDARGRESAFSALMKKRIDSVEWDQVPFQDVLTWLKEQGPINIIVRWRPLEVIGVDQSSVVTLSLRDSNVRTILTEVLSQLGGAEGETDPVQFHAINNTLTISTRSDFNRKLYVRVYDVTDLILRVPNFRDAPEIDLEAGQQGGGQGGGNTPPIFGGGGGGGGGDDDDQGGGGGGQGGQGDQEYAQQLEDLINLIKATIWPDTWEVEGDADLGGARGGGRGTIVPYRRALVVRNTIEVHEQLGGSFDY